MKITLEALIEQNACDDGLSIWERYDSPTTIRQALDSAEKSGMSHVMGYIPWLLQHFADTSSFQHRLNIDLVTESLKLARSPSGPLILMAKRCHEALVAHIETPLDDVVLGKLMHEAWQAFAPKRISTDERILGHAYWALRYIRSPLDAATLHWLSEVAGHTTYEQGDYLSRDPGTITGWKKGFEILRKYLPEDEAC